MRIAMSTLLLALVSAPVLLVSAARAQKVVVFEQAGFPTIDSEPLSHQSLASSLGGAPLFADVAQLRDRSVLGDAALLVMPYGSAFPAEAWPAVLRSEGRR